MVYLLSILRNDQAWIVGGFTTEQKAIDYAKASVDELNRYDKHDDTIRVSILKIENLDPEFRTIYHNNVEGHDIYVQLSNSDLEYNKRWHVLETVI